MKSGPNKSDEVKIRKMLADGAEPAGISAVLGIVQHSIEMYTPEGLKHSLELRELAVVADRKRAKNEAIALAKAEAQAEVDAEEEAEMLAKVKADAKASIKKGKVPRPGPVDTNKPTPPLPTKPPPGKPFIPPVSKNL